MELLLLIPIIYLSFCVVTVVPASWALAHYKNRDYDDYSVSLGELIWVTLLSPFVFPYLIIKTYWVNDYI